jgi:hypothetical protein
MPENLRTENRGAGTLCVTLTRHRGQVRLCEEFYYGFEIFEEGNVIPSQARKNANPDR